MDSWQRRTARYVGLLAAVMLVYTVLYWVGMRTLENDPQSFLHSLQVVVETFTTTGFGSDSPWGTPAMNAFVIAMNLTGVALIFLALPVLVFPVVEEMLSTTVPKRVPADTADHVVVSTHTPRVDAVISELQPHGVDYVIVEPDRETATELHEDGYTVINADPEEISGLERANLSSARSLLADVSDQVDASIVLAAREVSEDVGIVSVVEEPDRTAYHRLAGADEVLSPRPLLGRSLASKVTTAVDADLSGAIEVGEDLEIAELPVQRGSDVAGRTLAESGIRERSGANVIGAWFRGSFESPPSPDATIDEGTVLLVTGREEHLEALRELTLSEVRQFEHRETLVVGYGEVGPAVTEMLDARGLSYTVVDRVDREGVDVVGDATDPETYRAAGIDEVRSAILALPDDTTTEFATLVIRDVSPGIEVIARVEESQSTRKLYRAGADYVLSLATVSGRMIASTILEGEEVLSLDHQVDVVRMPAPGLAGQTVGEARIRSRTGCTVVAIQRDGEVITDVGPEFRIREGDELIVAGSDEGTNEFTEIAG